MCTPSSETKLSNETMPSYSTQQLETAVAKLKSNETGVNEASRQYGVPSRTLRRHLRGTVLTTRGPAPTLSEKEEQAIVAGLIERARKGFPATRLHIKATFIDIVSDGRKNYFPVDGPSRKWITRFLGRHSNHLSMRKGRILDSSRVDAVSEDEMLMFFAEYEYSLSNYDMDATRIYNCDETGVDPQGGSLTKVIAERGVKNVSIRRGCNRENTSMLMAVSSSGVIVPPLFIFKGKRFPSKLLHGAPAGSRVTVSENAFIDTELFDQWIDHFIANIPIARPVLLTLDNHSAHIALSMRRKHNVNGIHILSFPPHSTHILQPLDAGCFRSLKAQWRKVVNDWALQTLGQNIESKDRARLIGTALSLTMTPVVVQKSWESTGIWPLDHSAVRQGMVTRDTVDTSRFANYEIPHDPLPIGKLAGRSVRSLQRNGIDLSELRSYKLTVRLLTDTDTGPEERPRTKNVDRSRTTTFANS